MLNIYNIETSNYVNGNGCRYVLWVQGCDLKCVGCWNKQTWRFKPNILKSVDEIFLQIKKIKHNIDGVTFSGGEPFLQAKELSELAELIKKNTDLNIQIFSGFAMDELIDKSHIKLLKYTDILVSGRFDNSKYNNNQIVYMLNKDIDIWQFNNSDVEIDINDDMNIKITGYPTDELITEIKKAQNARI